MFLKNSRREEEEEEEERAGSPQLEADLAFELVLQVESKKLLFKSQKKQTIIPIFHASLNRTSARNGLKNLEREQDV